MTVWANRVILAIQSIKYLFRLHPKWQCAQEQFIWIGHFHVCSIINEHCSKDRPTTKDRPILWK